MKSREKNCFKFLFFSGGFYERKDLLFLIANPISKTINKIEFKVNEIIPNSF
jgi:hypothetical protein